MPNAIISTKIVKAESLTILATTNDKLDTEFYTSLAKTIYISF